MNKLRLLVIEDDSDFLKSYEKQVKLFNHDQSDVVVELIIAEEEEEAKNILTTGKIDAAIIDLKLGNTDVEYRGNSLLEVIKKNLRFPAFVVTGNPEKLEEEKGNVNDLFKLKVKGTEESNFTTILNELKEIHLTGITKILGKSGQIEKYLSEIFWKHLSNSINQWASDKSRNADQKEKSLLRYTLSHINEYLDLNDNGDFEEYSPFEFYLHPPVKRDLFTGDIVKLKEFLFVVLTPSCDIIIRSGGNRNAGFILLCRIKELSEIVKNFSLLKLDTPEKNDDRKRLCSYIENKNQRYHFIPKSSFIDAGLIDFQDNISIPSEKVDNLLKDGEMLRLAAIAMPFLKDIISRYSNNVSRQGSPDFNTLEMYQKLFK